MNVYPNALHLFIATPLEVRAPESKGLRARCLWSLGFTLIGMRLLANREA